ncbi:uncharacterized protein [Neodiprion pinetum]|uniref:uncharacterized protein n=1 Tax=Neodiprion pinetum TaxID=441929 RepID=UPI001EDD57E2|nr:laccase-2-like [Neodiprion pinetum]
MRSYKALLLFAALTIAAETFGTIIELPDDYNRASPWHELAKLGVGNLTQTDCLRTCVVGKAPRVCLYTFVLEYYASMGTACRNCSDGVLEDCYLPQCIPADGVQRGMMSVNRQLPGPPINVCKNDLIVVNVKNQMPGTGSTIHWHGILQKNSPWMDGVPYVTQCPIGESSFRYAFQADVAGTYFWHSHSGLQRVNGLYGALVIREPIVDEPWSDGTYDFDLPEHTIVLSDWMHETAEMFFPGLPNREPGVLPDAILINGLGRYHNSSTSKDFVNLTFPLATFHVSRNSSYRFRVINAASHPCEFQFQIEDHNMTLIATDGYPIEPITVDTFVGYPGERYDFVIDTSNAPLDKDAFWIHVTSIGFCVRYNFDQHAVLDYGKNSTALGINPSRTRPTIHNPLKITTVLNYPHAMCGEGSKYFCITDLRSIGRDSEAGNHTNVGMVEPNVRLVIPFNFHSFNVDAFHQAGTYREYQNIDLMKIRAASMNNITFKFPPSPIIFKEKPDDTFCNATNLPAQCQKVGNGTIDSLCHCTNVVVLKEGDLVELVLADADGDLTVSHPFHLHGYSFHVMRVGQNYKSEGENSLNHTYFASPLKDTVNVPSGGFVTIRFRADNPGIWMMHCHLEWHMAIGMGMAFWVEGNIPSPPPGFPRCGDFDPLN